MEEWLLNAGQSGGGLGAVQVSELESTSYGVESGGTLEEIHERLRMIPLEGKLIPKSDT